MVSTNFKRFPTTAVVFMLPVIFGMTTTLHQTTAVVAFSPLQSVRRSSKRAFFLAAAAGVETASPEEIRSALRNPATTVVDARTVEEMQRDGYFCGGHGRFVHAPSTRTEAPLLELAAESLIPDKSAPVVVYCASGMRANFVKKVLEEAGYAQVLNAGGLSDLELLKIETSESNAA